MLHELFDATVCSRITCSRRASWGLCFRIGVQISYLNAPSCNTYTYAHGQPLLMWLRGRLRQRRTYPNSDNLVRSAPQAYPSIQSRGTRKPSHQRACGGPARDQRCRRYCCSRVRQLCEYWYAGNQAGWSLTLFFVNITNITTYDRLSRVPSRCNSRYSSIGASALGSDDYHSHRHYRSTFLT